MSHRRLFKTFGARGLVNVELTVDFALRIGKALGSHLGKGKRVAVGRDPRIHGPMLEMAFISGLISSGVDVLQLQMTPTPVLCYSVPKLGCDGGVMVTASHNPAEWNGIKIVGRDGSAPMAEEEARIEELYFANKFATVEWNRIGSVSTVDAIEGYVSDMIEKFANETIRSKGFRVAVDGGGGANSLVTPKLLRDLGCSVYTTNCIPDGYFSERPPEPKAETLGNFSKFCSELGVELGVAHDGDGDRAVFVDDRGKIYPGDRTFALNCYWALKNRPGKVIVTNVGTSSVIRDVAKKVKARLEITAIGEPKIVQRMKQVGGLAGGEENGSFIWRDWSLTRDGMLALVSMLDLMAAEKKGLRELDDIFPKYYQVKKAVECPAEKMALAVKKIGGIIPKDVELITIDGYRLNFSDHEWLLIRPSGTEYKIRVFSESRNKARARELNDIGLRLVRKALAQT